MFKVHDMAVTGWHEDCSGGDIWACSVNPQVQVSIILMLICLMSETLINNQTIKKCKEILSNNLLGYNFCPAWTEISMRLSRGQMRASMDWPLAYSPIAWTRPTPWHVRSGSEPSGWTASTSSMLQFPLVGTRWAALGGRRALTAWRTTCKWRQSSPLSRTPRGCRCCKYGMAFWIRTTDIHFLITSRTMWRR